MRCSNKRAFSLLEIMVSIALLAMLAGFVAWKGNDLVQYYLFRGCGKSLIREIETAHLLALSYRTEISLHLKKKEGEFYIEWKTDEPRLAARLKPQKLRGVQNVRVDYKSRDSLEIAQFSSLAARSCEKIELIGRRKESMRIALHQGRIVEKEVSYGTNE